MDVRPSTIAKQIDLFNRGLLGVEHENSKINDKKSNKNNSKYIEETFEEIDNIDSKYKKLLTLKELPNNNAFNMFASCYMNGMFKLRYNTKHPAGVLLKFYNCIAKTPALFYFLDVEKQLLYDRLTLVNNYKDTSKNTFLPFTKIFKGVDYFKRYILHITRQVALQYHLKNSYINNKNYYLAELYKKQQIHRKSHIPKLLINIYKHKNFERVIFISHTFGKQSHSFELKPKYNFK